MFALLSHISVVGTDKFELKRPKNFTDTSVVLPILYISYKSILLDTVNENENCHDTARNEISRKNYGYSG